MAYHVQGAGRAITDYFNSPAYQPPRESELLEAIMMEMRQNGKPFSNDAIIASVIARLEGEADEAKLQGYRNLLTQIFDGSK
ncbi:biofilm development regulator YmgB/AriR family protein [Erwiniaceae bacterium CAU 1747]